MANYKGDRSFQRTQSRRSYLIAEKILNSEERIIIGFAWKDLREEAIKLFEQEKLLYGEDWPCQYSLIKVNKSDLKRSEVNSITYFVADVESFIIAAKSDFNKAMVETAIEEVKQYDKHDKDNMENLYLLRNALDIIININ